MEKQAGMVADSKKHDDGITAALEAHAKIVEEALEQEAALKQANEERELMKEMLAKQEQQVRESEKNRVSIMSAIAVQGEHMQKTKSARDELVKSVDHMSTNTKAVLDNIMSVIPADLDDDAKIVDAIVKTVSQTLSVSATAPVVGDEVQEVAPADEKTAATEVCPADEEHLAASDADRIIAARN